MYLLIKIHKIQKAKKNIREYKPAKGESWIDVMNRAKDFLNDVTKTHM